MSHVRKGSARVAGRRQADQGPHMVRKKVFFAFAVAFMVAVMVVGFILENSVSPVVTRLFGTLVDAPSEAAVTATNDSARALASEVEAQGAVLLANDGTLPLSSDATRVNVFGWASTDWQGGGSGSGCVTSVETDLISALNDAGIETNTELTGMYQDFRAAGKRPKTLSSKPEESSVLFEPSIADRTCYTEELLRDARDFSDTAIVVLQRYAGESNDMPLVQYKVNEKNGSVVTDATRTSLDLSTEEEASRLRWRDVRERHRGRELGKPYGAGSPRVHARHRRGAPRGLYRPARSRGAAPYLVGGGKPVRPHGGYVRV